MKAIAFLALAAFALPAFGARIDALKVARHGDAYKLYSNVYLQAPIKQVRHVLLDINHWWWISGAILESRILRRLDAHTQIVYVKSGGCVAFFCPQIEQHEIVRELSPDHIFAEAIPAQSNVRMSHTDWLLKSESGGTRLITQVLLVPDFAVPPLIGPDLIEHMLKQQSESGAHGIEKLARERAGLPQNTNER
jgi:hypothetical protein